MKRTVLTFGLLSGAVSSLMMLLTIPFHDRFGYDRLELIGFTTIVASCLLIFFGIRSYRDHVAGALTFGRAFTVGILITVVSCICYVATWQVVSRTWTPDFMDKYGAHLIERAKASGASQQEIDAKVQEVATFKRLYANPLFNIAFTFMEPFPIGLGVTLISAAVLRRKTGAATAPSRSPAVI